MLNIIRRHSKCYAWNKSYKEPSITGSWGYFLGKKKRERENQKGPWARVDCGNLRKKITHRGCHREETLDTKVGLILKGSVVGLQSHVGELSYGTIKIYSFIFLFAKVKKEAQKLFENFRDVIGSHSFLLFLLTPPKSFTLPIFINLIYVYIFIKLARPIWSTHVLIHGDNSLEPGGPPEDHVFKENKLPLPLKSSMILSISWDGD